MNKKLLFVFTLLFILESSSGHAAFTQSGKIKASIEQIYRNTITATVNTFEGFLQSVDIADETGDFLIVLKAPGGKGHVYLYDSDGELNWEIDADGARVSANGKAVLVKEIGYEDAQYRLYNRESKKLVLETAWIGHLDNGQVFTANGLFLYRNRIYKYDGSIKELKLPPSVEAIPWTRVALINENLVGVTATAKIDTIRANQGQIDKLPSKIKRRIERQGYLKKDYHNIFYLMDLQGNIIKQMDLGINGGGYLRPIGDKIMLSVRKRDPSTSQFIKEWFLLEENGTQLWKTDSPLDDFVNSRLYVDEEYIFTYSDNDSRFVIMNKQTGKLLDAFPTKGENLLGSLFGLYRNSNKVMLSYAVHDNAAGRVRFKSSELNLTNSGKIENIELAGQGELVLKLPRQDAFLYYTDLNSVQKESATDFRTFTIKTIRREQ